MTNISPEIETRRDRAKEWFESLQTRIFAELERLEEEAPADLYPGAPGQFEARPWTRETGTGGGIGGHPKGRLFEKAGVHTSAALARLSPPPETTDLGPLAALAAQLAAARQAVAAASATLDRRARELADMAARVAARLQALGNCPLCGGALSAGDFLGGGHVHAPEKDAS